MQSSARKNKNKPVIFEENVLYGGDVKGKYANDVDIDFLDSIQSDNAKRSQAKNQHTATLRVRLTAHQNNYISSLARQKHITKSALIRLALFGSNDVKYKWLSIVDGNNQGKNINADPVKIHELTVELKRVGTNLNQLTRLAHRGAINDRKLLKALNEAQEANLHTQEVLGCVIRGN